MEKKNKLILLSLIFFLILFLLHFSINYNTKNRNDLQAYLNKFKVSWKGTENFIVNVSLIQQTENENKLMAINENKIIRLEILTKIDEKTAEDYIRNKKYITDSLFLILLRIPWSALSDSNPKLSKQRLMILKQLTMKFLPQTD